MNENQQKILALQLKEIAASNFKNEDKNLMMALMAYLLWKKKQGAETTVGNDLMMEMSPYMVNIVVSGALAPFERTLDDYPAQMFVQFVDDLVGNLNYRDNDYCGTPEILSKLALSLLDVKPGDCVVDFGAGCGNFLSQVVRSFPENPCVGVEKDLLLARLAQIRLVMDSGLCDVRNADSFEEYANVVNITAPRKMFFNYPLGLFCERSADEGDFGAHEKIRDLLEEVKCGNGRCSRDWAYNLILCKALKEGDRAVAIMSSGCAWKMADKGIRKVFIENGWIDAMIELPAGLLYKGAPGCVMVVFSMGNSGVKFLDARKFFNGRRAAELFSDDHVARILSLYRRFDIECSNNDEIAQQDYIIGSRSQLNREETEDGERLGDLFEIFRGVAISSECLDKARTDAESKVRYLAPKDIVDGSLDKGMLRLDETLAKSLSISDRCILRPNDIVLTKNGRPYKVAIVDKESAGNKIIANGNLFILRPRIFKGEKAVFGGMKFLPSYVASLLNSEYGRKKLDDTYVGGTVSFIDKKSLEFCRIKLPPIRTQERFASIAFSKRMNVDRLKTELKDAEEDLKKFINTCAEYDDRSVLDESYNFLHKDDGDIEKEMDEFFNS